MHAGFVAPVALPSSRTARSQLCGRPLRAARAQAHAQARPLRTAPRAAGAALEVTGPSFEAEVLQSDIPVLVDFYAEWCGPCKLVAPLMTWAATQYTGKLKVVKVDTEKYKEFVSKYGIHGLPTFAVFRGGEAFGIQEGALGKQGLQNYIIKHVPECEEEA